MEENKEIAALLHLIDDPDEEVFSVVTEKIIGFGKPIIPNLEHLWENTHNEELQERIETLIHRLHFRDLEQDFRAWVGTGANDLLQGTILIARYQYPDLDVTRIYAEIEKIRRSIWLELNNYLTTLEQITVLSKILYNYHGLKGTELSYDQPELFFINKVLESKKGNPILNGIIYRIMAEALDIPIRVINIPRQFILAFFNPNYDHDETKRNPAQAIELYIDSITGHAFTYKEIENYFKRISVPPTASYFRPMENKRIVQMLLEELSKCYSAPKDIYKQVELAALAAMLEPE
jgi:regulator of sirC expression with transglutaminase-like and TPR domain